MEKPKSLEAVLLTGNGRIEMPLPMADKLAKFVATAHLVLNHPDGGEAYLGEMGIWLNDPEIRDWVKWMCGRMMEERS